MNLKTLLVLSLMSFCGFTTAYSQMITGIWKGRINRQKVELKIIQKGDSLAGTSYYYESPNNFRRYSIKGYFDQSTNEAVWWDDQLIEERAGKLTLTSPGKMALLSRADFNCPGGGSKMMLDGKSGKNVDTELKGDVHLDKTTEGIFEDEWNYVIDNYLVGGNDPYIIDSIATLYNTVSEPPAISEVALVNNPPVQKPLPEERKPAEPVAAITRPVVIEPAVIVPKPVTIEEKFVSRKKVLVTEIPITADSIELRFYDNAEIDGDSISLFLNNKLLFQHIRLTGNSYTIKLAAKDMDMTNELIMVAENLGSIPPNTSYMVALVGDKRYEARLESTEGSSAMVRFIR